MYVLTIIFGAIATLQFYISAESSKQRVIAGSLATGAKPALSFIPSLQTGTYQQDNKYYNFPTNTAYRPPPNKKCPQCDSSVYPYCGERLLHDACCCLDSNTYDLPYECKLADCRFLHANTCWEHRLIATCCCSDDYRSLLKSLSNV